ncbi:MAG: NfeD family protein [Planctomycetaceae bacterium]|jgi:membrane-bound ClpP family serine protease|nr:NfeD family protein [Planctomycetaceae bacterium]
MESLFWALVLLGVAVLTATLEAFLPSGGMLGFLALAATGGSIYFAFQHSPTFGITYVVVLMVILPLAVWQLLRWWPHTFIGRRILLRPEDDPALQPDETRNHLKELVGQTGVARTRMMPSGTVEINGARYDAISDGVPIDAGEPIRVTRVDGINITIRKIEQAEVAAASQPTDANTANTQPIRSTIEDPFA